jgi:hypothetical protein
MFGVVERNRQRRARETRNATTKKTATTTHIHHGLEVIGVLGIQPLNITAAFTLNTGDNPLGSVLF